MEASQDLEICPGEQFEGTEQAVDNLGPSESHCSSQMICQRVSKSRNQDKAGKRQITASSKRNTKISMWRSGRCLGAQPGAHTVESLFTDTAGHIAVLCSGNQGQTPSSRVFSRVFSRLIEPPTNFFSRQRFAFDSNHCAGEIFSDATQSPPPISTRPG
jgi:hypothetical protein